MSNGNTPVGATVRQAELNLKTPVTMNPFEETLGFQAVVPTPREIEGTVPAVEHYPYLWIDVYTGESLNRSRDPWGRAQQYGSGSMADVALDGEDFIRLADMQGVRIKLTSHAGSPGSCTITLQNALVGREQNGTWKWQREYFKPSRFVDGQTIRYLNRRIDLFGKGELWYRGKLHQVASSASADIVLEDTPFKVLWEVDGGPLAGPGVGFSAGEFERVTTADGSERFNIARGTRYYGEGRLDPSCFFIETAGEALFEPMQKIKIFGMNRFSPQVLNGYPYRPYIGPGGEKSVGEEDQEVVIISSESAGEQLAKSRPRQTTVDGSAISELHMFQYTGEAAFFYATPIFTGYITDVTNNQQGANWSIAIAARDVTCWLDYSQINVSPSLDFLGTDIVREAERQHWQIFTSRFETMPAHEIVRALYLGLWEGEVTATKTISDFDFLQTSTLYPGELFHIARLRQATEVPGAYFYMERPRDEVEAPRLRHKGDNGRPIVLPKGTRVYIQGVWPEDGDPEWYCISTVGGKLGYVRALDLGVVRSTYSGVGHFREIKDPTTPMIPIGMSTMQIKEMFASDKLIINPSIEPGIDDIVIGTYETYMRQNWPLVQSEYVSRRSIINQVIKQCNCECYADGDGRVWFHPVRAYQSVTDPVYIVHPEDTISWAITFSDKEILTWVHVHGAAAFHTMFAEALYGQSVADEEMYKRFGIRSIQISNQNIKSYAAAKTFARALMKRVNANKITGTVTMVFRPEVQLARNLYIPWLNVLGYVSHIDHNIQWGRTATSTFSLKYIRHPWERWSPLEYEAKEEQDQRDRTQAESNPDRGRKPVSNIDARYSIRTNDTLLVPTDRPDQSESKYEMRPYVHSAFLEAAQAIRGNLDTRCSVFKAKDSDGSETWRRGLALKVDVDTMDSLNVPGSGYHKAAIAANLNLIIATFREAGFRVVNNYKSTARWDNTDTKGHLVLIYNNPPPEDMAPEDDL